MNKTEKPLENIAANGGFARIFKTIACVGDSLSSGEFESVDSEGVKHYHDMFEYSWGQVIGRTIGAKVYNFLFFRKSLTFVAINFCHAE